MDIEIDGPVNDDTIMYVHFQAGRTTMSKYLAVINMFTWKLVRRVFFEEKMVITDIANPDFVFMERLSVYLGKQVEMVSIQHVSYGFTPVLIYGLINLTMLGAPAATSHQCVMAHQFPSKLKVIRLFNTDAVGNLQCLDYISRKCTGLESLEVDHDGCLRNGMINRTYPSVKHLGVRICTTRFTNNNTFPALETLAIGNSDGNRHNARLVTTACLRNSVHLKKVLVEGCPDLSRDVEAAQLLYSLSRCYLPRSKSVLRVIPPELLKRLIYALYPKDVFCSFRLV